MAAKKVGTLIKEARTKAGLTQEQLAKKVTGCSASDIGKAERGEKQLTQEQLKQIAKATGVTQKSLLDAAKGKATQTVVSASTGASASASSSMKLTANEKKLIQLYRKADDDKKKAALELLSKTETESSGGLGSGLLDTFLGLFRGMPEEGAEGEKQE